MERRIDPVLRFWRALDERFELVEGHPWGAVVTDARFPGIWDVNYARVERMTPGLTLARIEAALEPALDSIGAGHRHVVLFDPEEMTPILTAASARGATLSWDAVLTLPIDAARPDLAPASAAVEELRTVDDAFLDEVRASMVEFDVRDAATADQLLAIERAVLLPAGKRWFRVEAEGRTAALGSLLPIGTEALVDHVVTLPFARRRGFATAIVARMCDEAAAAGLTTVFLLTEPGGTARRIYERLGFRIVRPIASTRERRDASTAR